MQQDDGWNGACAKLLGRTIKLIQRVTSEISRSERPKSFRLNRDLIDPIALLAQIIGTLV